MLRLTGDQVEAALFAVADLVNRRRLEGRLVPDEVLALHRTLDIASAAGTESDDAPSQLGGDDLIDSNEAARLIGCSARWVCEIHADLDGRRSGRQWFFSRQRVIDYANEYNAKRTSGNATHDVA